MQTWLGEAAVHLTKDAIMNSAAEASWEWEPFITPVLLSLKVTIIASMIVFIFAVATARWMSRKTFIGKTWIETLIILPLVLSPTVIGFILLQLLGRRSWIGQFYEWIFNQPLIFTWVAAVIAAVVVAFPIVYQTAKVGFQSVDRELEDIARMQGANERQVFFHITAPLTWRFLISAFTLGFARALGEFGATMMIAGNIPGKTQTVPTAIYLAVDTGNTQLAWAWVISLVVLSFVMLGIVSVRDRSRT